jgi:RimJ/RimL family protein N-acetyltransferase
MRPGAGPPGRSVKDSLMCALERHLPHSPFTLDRRSVTFRLLRKEDTERWIDFVNECSMESLWFRFMVPFRATPERAVKFCDVDPEQELALVAEMDEGGRGRMIGIARSIRIAHGDRAEFALIVSDPWQRKMLGSKLSEMSVGLMRDWGVRSVFSETSMENYAMIKILKRCSFQVEERNGNMFTLSRSIE